MQRTILTLGAVAVVAVPSAAIAAKPPKQDPGGGQAASMTIKAAPDDVVFGRFVTLSGKLTGKDAGGRTVGLEADPQPFGDGFTELGRKQTSANGSYEIAVKPERSTHYRTVAIGGPAATSAEVAVTVRRRVTVRVSDRTPTRGERVRLSGSIAPASVGKTVAIQRQTAAGRWFTVARTVARDAGSDLSEYARRVRVRRSGSYRVKVPGDAMLAAGFSKTKTLQIS